MMRNHWLLLAAGLIAGLLISGRLVLLAQDRTGPGRPRPVPSPRPGADEAPRALPEISRANEPEATRSAPAGSTGVLSLQDALVRPYRFPFSRPTSLEDVCAHLKQTLKAAVVLDVAALDRQKVEPGDAVVLELDGVRLKTGLKLLLDQVGLTYRIVPEDNLMIITDREGSEDPSERVWSELRALHRDLHDVQDSLDELREYLGDEGGQGPRVRKPTIIEEMPENAGEKPRNPQAKPENPRQKPQGPVSPAPGARAVPSRVPLSGSRRVR
jgi:hypothetical protein